ncbi:MAG TPA: hypothetical protein VGM39_08185 [Kofleriaceae bacterium]|jgi:hypothetical protein
MGSSWIDVAPAIVKTALACSPRSVVDIGMGAGKYGFLLREQTDFAHYRNRRDRWKLHIDGVEGFADTVGDHQRAVYNDIFVEEALAFSQTNKRNYDVALVIDIIEHFVPAEGQALIENILKFADYVIVSTPRGYFSQAHENPLEHHRSWWPTAALVELARRCNASVSYAHVWMATVAVFSTRKEAVPVAEAKLRSTLRLARDMVVPERLYYRFLGAVGPTILE